MKIWMILITYGKDKNNYNLNDYDDNGADDNAKC